MVRLHTSKGTQTLYQVEAVYGTGSGTTQWFGFVQDHTPDENENRQPLRYVGGGDRNVDTHLDGPTEYRNSIPFIMQTGMFLGAAFGKVDSSSGTASTHTITESGINLPSFTVEEANDAIANEDVSRTHAGCMVDSLEISSSQGEAVMCTVDYIAQSVAQGSGGKTAVNAETDKPFMWSMCKLEGSGSDLDGGFNEMKDFSFRINNNLSADNYMNATRNVDEPTPLERDYEFNVTLNMAHGTGGDIYDKFYRAGSDINLDLWIFRTSGTDHINIWMSGCKTLDCDIPVPHEGLVELTWVLQPKSCGIFVMDANPVYPFSTV